MKKRTKTKDNKLEAKQRFPACSVSPLAIKKAKDEAKKMSISVSAYIEMAIGNVNKDTYGAHKCQQCESVAWSDDAGVIDTLYFNSSDGVCDKCGGEMKILK